MRLLLELKDEIQFDAIKKGLGPCHQRIRSEESIYILTKEIQEQSLERPVYKEINESLNQWERNGLITL